MSKRNRTIARPVHGSESPPGSPTTDEELTDEELLSLIPARLTTRRLMTMPYADLLTLHKAVQVQMSYWQDYGDARRISERLDRVEAAIEHRTPKVFPPGTLMRMITVQLEGFRGPTCYDGHAFGVSGAIKEIKSLLLKGEMGWRITVEIRGMTLREVFDLPEFTGY